MNQMSPPFGLAAHSRQVQRDLEWLGLPPANWTATVMGVNQTAMTDVVVIGAGMCGLAAAAALLFKGVRNICVLDRAPEGAEGPWLTYARMRTLRSPKHLPGIALGIPSLTYRAFHTACYGAESWEALYKISNADWMAYLRWFRAVLALPVENGVDVVAVAPADDHLVLTLADGRTIEARRVVVATGRPGAGGMALPEFVARDLWPGHAAHTGEAIDFARLAGRRVAVLGAGPSAWDNAAAALEAGAARVEMYVRRAALPQINKGRGSSNPGFFEGWATLSDAERWKILVYKEDVQSPPPHESVLRATAHANFAAHLATPVQSARREGDAVALVLGPDGRAAQTDFLIVGTGFAVDPVALPEWANLLDHAATWADRYTPPPDLMRPGLGRFPYLGPDFALCERTPGECPALARVHLFNHAAFASLGAIASDIPGVSTGAERLASRVAQAFFRDDLPHMMQRLEAFAEPELQGTPFFVPSAFTAG